MSHVTHAATDTARTTDVGPLYRAIWRWHFFAGLIVIPFMLLLAITGGLYLFKNEIARTVFAYRTVVAAENRPILPAETLIANAVAAVPGAKPLSYFDPPDATTSAVVKVAAPAKTLVWLNPYSGAVLDVAEQRLEFSHFVRKLHSLAFFGHGLETIIEATGGLAMVLVITGVYLWWPRRQTGGVVTIRGTPARRVFWRDTHAVAGIFGSVLIFFLAFSGMPWSGYWGNALNEYASRIGAGYPIGVWDGVPTSKIPEAAALDKTIWSEEKAPMPVSKASPTAEIRPIGTTRAIAIAKASGITPGFELTLPIDPTGVYTAQIFPADLNRQRTIHIDQYSGEPLVDLGYRDSGWIGRWVDYGVNIHMGQEWGRFNQLLMLAGVLLLAISSVAAVVMWWKRRPSGRLGVPPMPVDKRIYRVLWVIAAVFGVLFPISGLAIVAMVALDLLLIRTVKPLRLFFS
jgi:uncharacterized iron-regulated membrane protein